MVYWRNLLLCQNYLSVYRTSILLPFSNMLCILFVLNGDDGVRRVLSSRRPKKSAKLRNQGFVFDV